MKKNILIGLSLLSLAWARVDARESTASKDKAAMEKSLAIVSNALNASMGQIDNRMSQMEKSISNISEMVANQIQNFMLDLTVNNPNDKDCCQRILDRLDNIELLSAVIIQQIALQKQVIGNADDVSVDPNDFNSTADIDNAQISLVSWVKTIFRAVKDVTPIS